jgi:transcriptional regulator with GAF, ATPase, and Fis domain
MAAHRLMGVSLDVTERNRMEAQLQARLLQIEQLKQQLEQENVYLREEVKHLFAHEEIVGQSDAMQRVLAQVEQVAPTDSTVLIFGETGTGKEVIARATHNLSGRKARALVTVNCASLPPSLIESELFGREKGAYTGALTMLKGRFEVADGSTLFLDEIGELPLEVQTKLLRVLEEGRFERLGSTRTLSVDVRIIAASNRDLARDVEAGKFRRDLFYRLNVFPIAIPPLRERPEDIPPLLWAFVRGFEKRMGKRIERIPAQSLEALQRYAWPGNVRELRNVVEHAMIVSRGMILDPRVPAIVSGESAASQALVDVERNHILSVLEKTRWRLMGPDGAAERLGLNRTTLYTRMKKLGIARPSS